ncbi:uncharacterized protein RMCC_5808 [Mycolicibacterium canariasense]|uniref:Uncharacterized protein n=1 Tax=Mycolicibacterium canariasense TaxID=228230 RepID=A0A100WJ91_MYCCR|nr:uncharacterized protein RMCC_5808 [Mycolicibacterium canariasense]
MTAADVIAVHGYVPGVRFDKCGARACEWTGPGRMAHAAHVVDELKSAGFWIMRPATATEEAAQTW